jgi:hypothetical protein
MTVSRRQRFARSWDWDARRCGGPSAAYHQGGLEFVLHDEARPGQPPKYQTDDEAEVVALVCSAPPSGRKRWTIRLLTAAARQRPGLANVNRETVRQMLKKTIASLGAK